MISMRVWWLSVFFVAAAGAHHLAEAQDPLETETCRFLPQGKGKLVNAVEFQTSDSGTELDIPVAIEFGLLNTLELEVEPVVYTSIHPKGGGANVSGFGDTEITLKFLFLEEQESWPALAIAGEYKLPTARNIQIGTGEPDYTLTLIASKRLGDFDLHANLGYSIVGAPMGISVSNSFNYALAVVYPVATTVDLVGEVLGNTSSNHSGSGENSSNPEVAGGEVQVFLGARWNFSPEGRLFAGLGYDNNSALLVRLGISLRF